MASSIDSRLHMALTVKNLEKSIAFYTTLFEREPDKVKSGYARFDLENPGVVLTLNTGSKLRKGNRLDHMGIRISDFEALDRHLDRMKAFGCWIKEQRDVVCCHSRQSKFWVQDPDGLHWEFYVLVDDMKDVPEETSAAASNCCDG